MQEYAAPQGTTFGAVTLPDGFNPSLATDATLRAFHFPPRPTDPGALAEWTNEYAQAFHEKPASVAPCVSNVQTGSISFNNWAGRQEVSSGFTDVTGHWTQPNFEFYCLHASSRAIWDGIGEGPPANSVGLIQAGTVATGSGINTFTAFAEVWPLENVVPVSPPAISTGDTVNVDTSYSTASGGTANWLINNLTKKSSKPYYQYPISKYYDGRYAEYIDERPKFNGTLQLLRRSTNYTYWSGEYVNGKQANSWPTNNITMKDTDTLMTTVIGATITSSETWNDCGPGSGTNQ